MRWAALSGDPKDTEATGRVAMEVVERICTRVAGSGKPALCDIAELTPALDADDSTARAGDRLIHTVLTARKGAPSGT